jgi:hypothetical protein
VNLAIVILSLIEARLKCADEKRSFSASRGEPKR